MHIQAVEPLLKIQQAGLVDVDASIFVQAAIFLVTLVALNALVWKPILAVIDLRMSKIEGTIQEAKRVEADAEQRIARYEAQITEARRAGVEQQREIRERAERRAAEIAEESQKSASAKLEQMLPQVHAAYESSRASLRVRSEDLATRVADKVLGTQSR